jgi:hypothetical protein
VPPHVASPARLFAREVDRAGRALAAAGPVEVPCEGGWHRIGFDGEQLYAEDHDEAAEAVVASLGGPRPACVRALEAAAAADVPRWWAAVAGVDEALRVLPEGHRRFLLARALLREFAGASGAVRDSVAQLGLAVVADTPPAIDTLRVKFQMTRELPHWDTGPGPWSDKELVLLHRCFRATPGEARPHLTFLPSDPLARSAVARYVVGLLDPARVLTPDDLRVALLPTFRNVRALTALLVGEGVLVPSDGGGHRVARPGGRRPAGRRRVR